MRRLLLILGCVLALVIYGASYSGFARLSAMSADLNVLEAAQAAAISIRVTVDGVNTDQTFTARQIALLNRRLADFNAQRTANGQATVTMGVFLRGFIVQSLKNEQDEAERHEQAEACAAFFALAQNAQNQIKAALGDKSPCR